MVLQSVKLKNFRNHKEVSLNFSDKLNYIIGGNGTGKTSIIESIYYLCTTKNFNSNTDSEVVRFTQEDFEITGKFKDISENIIRVYYYLPDNKKVYFLNGKQISRSSEVIGNFPVVILTPGDHSITQGYPADRRKFIDSVISQANRNYLSNLLEYNRILKQRSSLLNQLKEFNRKELLLELDAWTERLVETGTNIIEYRKKFKEDFADYIQQSYNVIMGETEVPDIHYFYLDGYTGNDIKGEFTRQLANRHDDELRRAVNLAGPHRDDFIFAVNKINLKTYGSQGQNKTFQIVLRFAEFFYLKEITGKVPIFLLDDVFGELDANRSGKISEYLREVGQAFITLTDLSDMNHLNKKEEDRVIKLHGDSIIYA